MTLRQIYVSEGQYLTLDEIREACDEEWGDVFIVDDDTLAMYVAHRGLEAATCHLCERPLPAEHGFPLCPRCTSTAKAHARLALSADPDAEMDRARERRMGR